MIVDNWIQAEIEKTLIKDNADREAAHEPSGRLSASMLWMPTLCQVYKTIGVPKKPMEAYVLGKFKRGDDVENWFVGQMEKLGVLAEPISPKKPRYYREVVGFADAIVNSEKMWFKHGIIPHEVKSVTNIKIKRIAQTEVDYHYRLQACFYAMAMKLPYYAVDVVSAEDLRSNVYVFETAKLAPEVDKIITTYDTAMKNWKEKHVLPAFEPNINVPWSSKVEYLPQTPEWYTGPADVIVKRLEELKIV